MGSRKGIKKKIQEITREYMLTAIDLVKVEFATEQFHAMELFLN